MGAAGSRRGRPRAEADGADASDHQEAALLGTATSAPVLGIESVSWLQSGPPMEYYYALHRTDENRLHVVSR